MANLYDLLLAIMEIGRADIGAGGLAGAGGLTGKDTPIRRWEDYTSIENPDSLLPITTVFVVTARPNSGAPPMLQVTVQFDAWAKLGSEGLESQMIERIEAIMTSTNFQAEGLDVGPNPGVRRTMTAEDFGRRRESMDIDLLLKT